MPTVYITHEVAKRVGNGAMRSIMDFTPACKYGDLEVVVPANYGMLSTVPVVSLIEDALQDFTSDDYIIPTGDPVIMMICGVVAARKTGGKFNVLRWDRKYSEYIPVKVSVDID